jgi:hypothetical protein
MRELGGHDWSGDMMASRGMHQIHFEWINIMKTFDVPILIGKYKKS